MIILIDYKYYWYFIPSYGMIPKRSKFTKFKNQSIKYITSESLNIMF